ncbi:SDR family NAD(P)-dependent oxidoreductase [Streptomyces spiramenti]
MRSSSAPDPAAGARSEPPRDEPRRALVTGGSRGLGLGVAMRLAEAGYRTTVAARTPEGLAEAVARAHEAGLELHPQQVDVTDEDSVRDLFARVTADGPLHVCVNNAGANSSRLLVKPARGDRPLQRYPLADWENTLRLCLTGVFLTGREAAAAMVEAGVPGVIVQISSAARGGAYGQSGYSAAKSGVDALTRTWALELAGHGIRVVGVAPGVISSEALHHHCERDPRHAEYMERLRERIPARRWAEVREIADAVLFAAENSYLTGTTLEVDGGGLPDRV